MLLRVLLSVSLIANGIGFAQASTRMQLAHASHSTVSPAAEAPPPAECHEPPGAPSGKVGQAVPHTAVGHGNAGAPSPDHASVEDMECCDGGNCQCVCTQQAFAAFALAIAPGTTPVHTAVLLEGTSQHASPWLPHLIRPPIG